MNGRSTLLIGLMVILALAPSIQANAANSLGYVVYGVRYSSNGVQREFSVNESVTTSSHQGESILSLFVESASTNLTYSHLINSSSMVFPYLPAITNSTFTYSNDSYSITASITQSGSSQVTFQGNTYTLSDYALSATFSDAHASRSATGTLSAFGSGLVYSVSLSSNGALVSATLTSTSLQLKASSSTPSTQLVSAGVGISVALAAVFLSLGIRARHRNESGAAEKPDHWVD